MLQVINFLLGLASLIGGIASIFGDYSWGTTLLLLAGGAFFLFLATRD